MLPNNSRYDRMSYPYDVKAANENHHYPINVYLINAYLFISTLYVGIIVIIINPVSAHRAHVTLLHEYSSILLFLMFPLPFILHPIDAAPSPFTLTERLID